MSGVLTLVPTPIDDLKDLHQATKNILLAALETGNALIVVEEAKTARRRWLHYGLPRETIDTFYLYNEHTRDLANNDLVAKLQAGTNIFLMSDCGLPAFCDPGMSLVDRCHEAKIKVTSTAFDNSVILAVALCGFNNNRFVFEGFIPARGNERTAELKRITNTKEMCVLMDTPYRLQSLVQELAQLAPMRRAFLAMNLNGENEGMLRFSLAELAKKIPTEKCEFILILEARQ